VRELTEFGGQFCDQVTASHGFKSVWVIDENPTPV